MSRGEFCPKCGLKECKSNRIGFGIIKGLFIYALIGGILILAVVVYALVVG
jgi:hypothetical protein